MTALSKLILWGAFAVVIYDTTASVLSKGFGVSYGKFGIGSLLIYAAVGFLASRGKAERTAMAAVIAGGIVGFVDATIGWATSAAIGPGHPVRPLTPFLWTTVAIGVMLSSILLAVIGYAVESLILWRFSRK
jgi:hypothetical protein